MPIHLGEDGDGVPTRAEETVERSLDCGGRTSPLQPDGWVSMHWEWICDRLTERQVRTLPHYTDLHLKTINDAGAVGTTRVLS